MTDRRILLVHAHPDDETIGTGATMARYVDEGVGVTLVTCTLGEEGEVLVPGLEHLASDREDRLGEHRQGELAAAMGILGVQDWRLLGGPGRYRDSGMIGTPPNERPEAFWRSDLLDGAADLVGVIREVRPQVLVTYDDFGGYGHPDHIQVHRVGLRAAQLAGTPEVFQGTMNSDHIRRSIQAVRAQQAADGIEPPTGAPTEEELDTTTFGKPEVELTHAIDVRDVLEVKRAAMVAHQSQIASDSWFLTMDDESFAMAFGTEWFIRTGHTRGVEEPFSTSLWDGH